MGPRLCSRGEIRVHKHCLPHHRVAMGPRLCSRGETREVAEVLGVSPSQWGHGFVAVERRPPRSRPRGGRVAMGPRLCSRGEGHDHAQAQTG